MIDIDPGDKSTFDDVLVLARLHRTALDHLGVEGGAKVTGKRGIQIWFPVADGLHLRRHADVGRAALPSHRRRRARHGQLGVGGRQTKGLARLDYTQNAINKTLVAPFSARPPPGLRYRCRSVGTSSTTLTCDRTDGRSTPSANACRRRRSARPTDRAPAAAPQSSSVRAARSLSRSERRAPSNTTSSAFVSSSTCLALSIRTWARSPSNVSSPMQLSKTGPWSIFHVTLERRNRVDRRSPRAITEPARESANRTVAPFVRAQRVADRRVDQLVDRRGDVGCSGKWISLW